MGEELKKNMNPVRGLARDKVASPKDLGEATSNGMNPVKDTTNKYITKSGGQRDFCGSK